MKGGGGGRQGSVYSVLLSTQLVNQSQFPCVIQPVKQHSNCLVLKLTPSSSLLSFPRSECLFSLLTVIHFFMSELCEFDAIA